MNRDEFVKSGRYLPKFLRDFHDQKDLFKWLDTFVSNAKQKDANDHLVSDLPNWRSAQIYVIDFFLWYMGLCGYTLQKTRTKCDNFSDIEANVRNHREEMMNKFFDAANNPHNPT